MVKRSKYIDMVKATEFIEYKGVQYNIFGTPFRDYLENNNVADRPSIELKEEDYICHWKLENNNLFLISLKTSTNVPILLLNIPVLANWFIGKIEFDISNMYVDFDSKYLVFLWLDVVKGNVMTKHITKRFKNDFQIKFGKYKGQPFSKAIKDISYIKWAIINVKDFSAPPQMLGNLPSYDLLKEVELSYNAERKTESTKKTIDSLPFVEQLQVLNLIKILKIYNVLYNSKDEIFIYSLKKNVLDQQFGYFLYEDYEPYELEDSFGRDGEDYDRDYFNIMTDGQLGDYDDFEGNPDDIDTWSRG